MCVETVSRESELSALFDNVVDDDDDDEEEKEEEEGFLVQNSNANISCVNTSPVSRKLRNRVHCSVVLNTNNF